MGVVCNALLLLLAVSIVEAEFLGWTHPEDDFQLSFISVSSKEHARSVTESFDKDGLWWTQIGSSIYSPGAQAEERQRNGMFVHDSDLDHYYVAYGHQDTIPESLNANRVGGEHGYHIIYMPDPTLFLSFIQEPSAISGEPKPYKCRSFKSDYLVKMSETPIFLEAAGVNLYPYSDTDDSRDGVTVSVEDEKKTVDKIQESRLMDRLQNLVDFGSRNIKANVFEDSTAYLTNEFEQMGFETYVQSVIYSGVNTSNVIARMPGTTKPDEFVLIGAHYDTVPDVSASSVAPGAEDNGSGSATVLEIAKSFKESGLENDRSIFFILFTAEEEGLFGSEQVAKHLATFDPTHLIRAPSFLEEGNNKKRNHKRKTNNFKGAVIMDMVGYKTSQHEKNAVILETKSWTTAMVNHLAHSSKTNNGDELDVYTSYAPFGSDHMPFLNRHEPAVLTIDKDWDSYPYYHKSTDTIDHVTSGLAHAIARMNMGALIRLANDKNL